MEARTRQGKTRQDNKARYTDYNKTTTTSNQYIMDVVLDFADEHILDKAWSAINPAWGRDHILRQCVSVSMRIRWIRPARQCVMLRSIFTCLYCMHASPTIRCRMASLLTRLVSHFNPLLNPSHPCLSVGNLLFTRHDNAETHTYSTHILNI